MGEILKVESLESSLRYMEFSEKDLFFWETHLNYRIRFPRKMKKRLSLEDRRLRECEFRMRRLVMWQLKYPKLGPYVRVEIKKLKEKYALVA